MKIGYARVSTRTQHLDRQIEALKKEGCTKIYSEKQSAVSMKKRPELDKAIEALGVDDVIVFAEWDRATRSMDDGIEIIHRVHHQGAMLKALDRPYLDLTTPLGKGLAALLSSFAEDERERILKRAREGRKAAKKRGVHLGRKERFPVGSPARKDIEERLRAEESCRTISSIYGCSHRTIARIRDTMC